jgi:hypothetical protein
MLERKLAAVCDKRKYFGDVNNGDTVCQQRPISPYPHHESMWEFEFIAAFIVKLNGR